MPYTSEHKARTRSKIVESARRLFNRHGFEQVSIDRIMAEAGLTRGGFYNHFVSKDAIYAAAVASFATCNPFRASVEAGPREPRALARLLVEIYLSDKVLGDIDAHCPLYALCGDVYRAGLAPQQAYTDLIRGLTAVFTRALQDSPGGVERAQVIVSLCVGAMVLSRTTDDLALRQSIRASTRRQALTLLDH
jgi:TetR/AcrR family transcriptional repressor of nem operon